MCKVVGAMRGCRAIKFYQILPNIWLVGNVGNIVYYVEAISQRVQSRQAAIDLCLSYCLLVETS